MQNQQFTWQCEPRHPTWCSWKDGRIGFETLIDILEQKAMARKLSTISRYGRTIHLLCKHVFCLFLNHYVKVSRSQKHFFLKLHCPKNERYIWQNSALASYGRILSNILFVIWAMEFQEKLLLRFTDL